MKPRAGEVPWARSLTDGTRVGLAAPIHPTLFGIHLPPVYATLYGTLFWYCTDRTSLNANPALIAKVLQTKIYGSVCHHRHIRGHCRGSEVIAELLGDHMTHSSLFPHARINEGGNYHIR